jgi:toxin ParE1/3/4
LVSAIAAQFEPLCHFPLSGADREHLAPGLRVTFHIPYAIYYRPQPEALVIIRVIHGARDLAALAERGGFT